MRVPAQFKPVFGTNRWIAILAVALALCAGCYDGSEMVKQAQTAALKTRLAEIDLGKFQTTLPRDPVTNRFTAIDIHIFGTVPRYRLAAVTKQIKDDENRVRHQKLAAVRKSPRPEMGEPAFAHPPARLWKTLKAAL